MKVKPNRVESACPCGGDDLHDSQQRVTGDQHAVGRIGVGLLRGERADVDELGRASAREEAEGDGAQRGGVLLVRIAGREGVGVGLGDLTVDGARPARGDQGRSGAAVDTAVVARVEPGAGVVCDVELGGRAPRDGDADRVVGLAVRVRVEECACISGVVAGPGDLVPVPADLHRACSRGEAEEPGEVLLARLVVGPVLVVADVVRGEQVRPCECSGDQHRRFDQVGRAVRGALSESGPWWPSRRPSWSARVRRRRLPEVPAPRAPPQGRGSAASSSPGGAGSSTEGSALTTGSVPASSANAEMFAAGSVISASARAATSRTTRNKVPRVARRWEGRLAMTPPDQSATLNDPRGSRGTGGQDSCVGTSQLHSHYTHQGPPRWCGAACPAEGAHRTGSKARRPRELENAPRQARAKRRNGHFVGVDPRLHVAMLVTSVRVAPESEGALLP